MYGVFTYDCGALPKHYASYRDLGDANREVDYLTNIGVRAWVFKRDTSVVWAGMTLGTHAVNAVATNEGRSR
jgi:hypothetical protein